MLGGLGWQEPTAPGPSMPASEQWCLDWVGWVRLAWQHPLQGGSTTGPNMTKQVGGQAEEPRRQLLVQRSCFWAV